MKRKALLNVAASSLIVAVTMVGCNGAAMNARPANAGAKAEKAAATLASTAERALAKRDVATALASAEAAVTAQPDSVAYRILLGRAYLADGRFESAETAFEDVMTLGNSDTRTIISLSLAKIALGKSAAARALLTDHMDTLPAADYGLAIAMAGDPQEAVRILSLAAQAPEAGIKTRQNLAYAYALSGQWREARIMAAQDLDPLAAMQRITTWAQTAQPGAEAYRVAALVGTNVRADDAGMPSRLALAPAAAVQVAEAPIDAPIADAAPVEIATVAPEADPAPVAAMAVPQAPVIRASETPARQLVRSPRPMRIAGKPAMQQVALIRQTGSSPWVVQLGAYDSSAIAKERWQRMAQANAELASFSAINSTVTVKGKLFHRLAVSGFGDRGSADQMCRTIRAQKGQCFVRAGTPADKPKQWASAKPKRQQIASR